MGFVTDLRRAARTLAKRPLFALVAVLTLALGIGANTAMLLVLQAAVLRPLPFPEPERLVRVYSAFEGQVCCTVSAPSFLDLAERSRAFELAAYSPARSISPAATSRCAHPATGSAEASSICSVPGPRSGG